MSDKLSINNEMYQLDTKNREFWDELTEQERKDFSTFLMMKYSANVSGSSELQEWYLRASNERMNQNFFDIAKHPKLQWLCATSVSPGMGSQRHYWLASKKKEGSNSKAVKFLSKLFPEMKVDEVMLLAQINDSKELKALAKSYGMTDEQIKKELG